MDRDKSGRVLVWLFRAEDKEHTVLQVRYSLGRDIFMQAEINEVFFRHHSKLYSADFRCNDSDILSYVADSCPVSLSAKIAEQLVADITE
ncbi:hypothetical protein NDU88_001955 [Pleurodeles waltl]|uniref:Uncharacterized protein n=1 Tax=Pleurodeles waltl TaxID=8319 RepID=A0AAV7WNU5_PLEWA|nr:hypothetical protein NDU88_001955 [Pleurodeles waltl]